MSSPAAEPVAEKRGLWQRLKTQRPGVWVFPLLAVLTVGLIFVIVGPVFLSYRNDASAESAAKQNFAYVGAEGELEVGCPDVNLDGSGDPYIYLEVSVLSLVAAQSTVKMVVDMYPVNGLAVKDSRIAEVNLPGNSTLVVYVGRTRFSFKDGAPMSKSTIEEILAPENKYSSSVFYPMDSYVSTTYFQAYLELPPRNGSTIRVPVGLCAGFNNQLPSFDANLDKADGKVVPIVGNELVTGAYTLGELTVTFARTKATRFFSIFIVILMWLLTSMMFLVALDHVLLRPREPAPPTVGLSVALLFALPAVRNTQPEVPPIGAAVDVLGFFWNMSLTALSAAIFMAAFAGYHKYSPMK